MNSFKKCLILLVSLLPFVACVAQTPNYQSVSADQFEKIIAQKKVILLDVRTLDEYNKGYIPGATLVDVTQPKFEERVAQYLKKKHTIALYCRSGRRSKKAAEIISKMGYNVVELNTGFSGWEKSGKKTAFPQSEK